VSHASVLHATHEDLYRAKVGRPEIVEVPPATFLMLDGTGDPNKSPAYAIAIQSLFTAAYTIKFAIKKAGGPDVKVAPLEGLWWGAEAVDFAADSKDTWSWTMMIRLPDDAPASVVADSLKAAAAKKPELAIDGLRVERFAEGQAAQVMYQGPYSDEHDTIVALHEFIATSGHRLRGKHHEIYLGDPRRSAPEKLKTLIRQPVA
jgi:hypothetical protein